MKAALLHTPQMDSIYVGYDTGSWLQVQRMNDLSQQQRERLRGPQGSAFAVSLIRPTSGGALPMRQIFEDEKGNELEQLDLWNYGYDPRKRAWYIIPDCGRWAGQIVTLRFVYDWRAGGHHKRAAARKSAWRHRCKSQARCVQ